MPLRSFKCQLCGACCPEQYLTHGQFANRMKWLREHRQEKHPGAFWKSIYKGVTAKKGGRPKKNPNNPHLRVGFPSMY